MVPEGWLDGRVIDFLKLQRGFDLTKAQSVFGPYPVYSSSGIAYYHAEAKVQPPGIVTGRKGSVGPVYYIEEAFWPHDTSLWVCDFKGNLPKFLWYFLQNMKLERLDEASSVPTLNRNNVHSKKCQFPPLPEQRKIADILSTWDQAIEKTEGLLSNARTQKRALMQQLLTGKRRFPDFEGQPWQEVRLGDLGATFNGLTGKTKDDFGEGYPFIPYMNIFANSRIDVSHVDYVSVGHNERQSRVQYGDLFFTTSSETPNEVGMSSVMLDEMPGLFLNSFCFGFRLHDFETLRPRFARFLLRGQDFRRSLHRLAQGATRYNLSKTNLMNTKLVLPPVDEQEQITDTLEIAQLEEDGLRKEVTKLRTEKKALMQQLLTGKRRVQV